MSKKLGLIRGLIRRSLTDGKGGRVLSICELRRRVRIETAQDVECMKAFLKVNGAQPQSIRALNAREEREGSGRSWNYYNVKADEAPAGGDENFLERWAPRGPAN